MESLLYTQRSFIFCKIVGWKLVPCKKKKNYSFTSSFYTFFWTLLENFLAFQTFRNSFIRIIPNFDLLKLKSKNVSTGE